MRRDTLLDFFDDFADLPSDFVVHDDGYRTRTYRYADVGTGAAAFATRLSDAGVAKGEKILLWSENRPEWLMALWGALRQGVIVVPIDYRASPDLVRRVHEIVKARALVHGSEVAARTLEGFVPLWPMADLASPADIVHPGAPGQGVPIGRDDIAEIIFTSGATADPKGVVITHRNILANIVPIEGEVRRYRKYGRPFFPIRFLNLLPLSHMFGQAMAAFVPPMLPGVTVFMRGYSPAEIARQIQTRRISVVVCVPKILDVLREFVVRRIPQSAQPAAGGHVLARWWRHRRVHRLFGWKFWCFVVGAAPLDPELEGFWSRLGFLVIQGYGLTETAPIVTLNHPFRTRRGTVGTPIQGVEVRIAPDGEILVRGENVTSGYFGAAAETREAFEGGWLHTGDIGELDEAGRLFVRGRKKEMIVTPEGLNVFPEDVERVLAAQDGVRDAAVVGARRDGQERVHAVLVLDPHRDHAEVVRRANAALEDHQKIRDVSIWPEAELPRTEGTRKLRRRQIKQWVETGTAAPPAATAAGGDTVEAIVARFAGDRPVASETTLDELGLSSLERMELLLALEEQFSTTLDESALAAAQTVADLDALIQESTGRTGAEPRAATPAPPRGAATAVETIRFPSWSRATAARFVRRISLTTWVLPLARAFAWTRVEGREHLEGLARPVVFAANHQSHMDTPIIFGALPARWRRNLAVAMAKEFFRAHFFPAQHSRRAWFANTVNYYLAVLFFNAFPLPQREAGTRQALRYIGQLVDEGSSIVIFPEGRRSQSGEISEFLPGIALIGARLDVPVVPVRLEGADRVLHQTSRMARPGPVRVAFGAPLRLKGEDYSALARQVEAAVRAL